MGNCLKIFALVLGLSLAVGCASPKNSSPVVEKSETQRLLETQDAVADANQAVAGHKLVKRAHTAIGTPYVLGGSNPGGFDCSGLVKWAYKGVGIKLPRTAREQSVIGKKISRVEDMRAGDIVAFRHPKRGYHTGIYVGDGKFIHSPRKRTTVRINSLSDPYFRSTLLGARRVAMDDNVNLVAQADDRLGKLVTERAIKHGKAGKATKVGKVAKGKKSRATIAVASKSKRSAAVAAKSGKKKIKTVAANHSKSSRHDIIRKSRIKSRTIVHNTAPVKAPARQFASRKSNHKAVSMLNQSKSSKRSGKNSRS